MFPLNILNKCLLSSVCNECVPVVYDLLSDTDVKCVKILYTDKNIALTAKYIDGHFELKRLSKMEFNTFFESLFLLYDIDFTNSPVVSKVLPYTEDRNVKVVFQNDFTKAITIRKLWKEC